MADLTPTERAVNRLRARRAAGRSQDNDTGLLLTAYDQLEGEAQELRAKAAVDARHLAELENELERARPCFLGRCQHTEVTV